MGFSSWLDQHIEEFIKPNYGGIIPEPPKVVGQHSGNSYWPLTTKFLDSEVDYFYRVLDALRKRAEQLSKPVLFPGRDMWELEILCRLEGFPTTFRPELSSVVSHHMGEVEDFTGYFVLDNGFRGTVPKNLKANDWALIKQWPVGSKGETPQQLIQDQALRDDNAAHKMESTPKYWTPGKPKYDSQSKVIKPWTLDFGIVKDPNCFAAAALHTMELAKRFIARRPASF